MRSEELPAAVLIRQVKVTVKLTDTGSPRSSPSMDHPQYCHSVEATTGHFLQTNIQRRGRNVQLLSTGTGRPKGVLRVFMTNKERMQWHSEAFYSTRQRRITYQKREGVFCRVATASMVFRVSRWRAFTAFKEHICGAYP